jgi:hypothetical protein
MPKRNRTILQEGIMSELLGEESKRMRRSLRRTRSGLFLVLLLLLALVSSAYADQLCTVCHGPNGPHTPQCGDTTTCGVSCHQGKLDAIMHPAGAGTPISGSTTTTDIATACKTCHQFPGTTHPFRINTVPGMVSVYPDLDQACGQCHGGGTDSAGSPPNTGVVYLTKNQLAVVAPNIHSGTTTSWLNSMDCTLCHNGSPIAPAAVSHPTGTGTPGSGAAACRSCHLANGILHQKAAVSVDKVCAQCHGGSRGPGAVVSPAPYYTETLLAEAAIMMHDSNKASTVNCEACHAAANPVAETLSAMGHPQSAGTPGCIQCHTTLLHTGAAPVAGMIAAAACSTCHGASGSAHKFTGFSNQPLTAFATSIHTKADPGTACPSCHTERPVVMGWAVDGEMSCPTCHITTEGARPGIAPTAAQACYYCHGGSSTTTHNGAVYRDATTLAGQAANFHGAIPAARFTWQTDATADYKVLYDASGSTCPVGATCSYSWSTGETGTTASHTFASSATTTVTLTVTASNLLSNSASKAVTPAYVAAIPTSLGAGLTVTPNGFSPTVTWSVSGGVAPYTIQAIWGDGTNSTTTQAAAGPGSSSHTYLNSGIYTVTITATDSGVNGINITTATASTGVTINPVSVSGIVTSSTGTPLSGVSLSLQQGGVTKKLTTTAADGTYVFTNVAPGCYTVVASKSGYTFANPVSSFCVDGTANVTGVNIAANAPAAAVNVTGTVTRSNGTTAISGVALSLRLNGVTKYLASTDGSGNFTFANVANGTYTIVATKSGYTFANPAATVTVSGSTVTANFSSLTP